MQAGLVSRWELLEFSLGASMSGSRTSDTYGVSAGAGLSSLWTSTAFDLNTGFALAVSSAYPQGQPDEDAYGEVTFQVPDLGIDRTETYEGFQGALSARVEVDELRVYRDGTGWLLTFDELRYYLGEVLDYTHPSTELPGLRPVPAGVPLFGIPWELSAGASTTPQPNQGVPAAYAFDHLDEAEGTCSATGGWRFKEPGATEWTALTVTVGETTPGQGGCCTDAPAKPSFGATTTGNGTASARSYQRREGSYRGRFECHVCPDGQTATSPSVHDVYDEEVEVENTSSSVRLVPDLEKAVERLGPDYVAMIYRGGLPYTLRSSPHTCINYVTEERTDTPGADKPHPSMSVLLSTVTNSAHPIEEPFGYASLAPYSWGASRFYGRNTTDVVVAPGACPGAGLGEGGRSGLYVTAPSEDSGPEPCIDVDAVACYDSRGSSFPAYVEDADTNSHILGWLWSDFPIARYIDYWVNPHWSYNYWFPPDQEGALKPGEWPLYDARANASEYWVPMRTQWVHNPALPRGEERRTRTDLISAPLIDGAINGFYAGVYGQYTSPWGICRFDAQQVQPPDVELGPSSSPGWTGDDCTLSFGATEVTLTPDASATTVKAEYDLGRLTELPHLLPHLARAFAGRVRGASVTAVRVKLVGRDGAETVLAQSGSADYTFADVAWPQGALATRYAGTWGQLFSAYDATDQGTDSEPEGISGATMADNEGVHVLGLTPGYTAAKLVFEADISSDADDVLVMYPAFTAHDEEPVVLPETGQCQLALWPRGPGLRHGQHAYWDYDTDTFSNPPYVGLVCGGRQSTALDWLCWRRTALEGVAATDGLDAELATLYDSREGQSRQDAAYGTGSFIVSRAGLLTGIFHNSYSEVPALAVLPHRGRGADMAADGDHCQVAYSHAHEPRYVVSQAPGPVDLYSPAGARWTSEGGPAVEGWNIVRHRRAVTNSEGPTYTVQQGEDYEYATVTPWHGYHMVYHQRGQDEQPWLVETDCGKMLRASIDSDTSDVLFKTSWSTTHRPQWAVQSTVTSTGDCHHPRHDYDRRFLRVWLAYERENLSGGRDAWWAWSDDWGGTWQGEILMADAYRPMVCCTPQGDVLVAWFVFDGGQSGEDGTGTIQGRWRGRGDESFGTAFTFLDGADAPISLPLRGWGNVQRAWEPAERLVMVIQQAGDDSVSTWANGEAGEPESWRKL